ncbi:SusC/RagA family TonB-linked outer membrane protein [Segetibacter sp. 3557_3]|uniref:SusC/RagA family TonB-linked outer membrane protein n=1 Tax=Segetibacter sp. 3557_3 TaxID=2547429 RepID=UPI001404A55A|nr:TonB-dependent receptor [Segetibacter sp. 3557_3]
MSGTIKDASGNNVGAVSVNVKGSNAGTTTDSSGRYTISVPGPTTTLVFSSVGFGSQEQIVGSRRTINVTLSTTASSLDEVVVVGYGTQRKRDVTGAITSVSAKQIEERQAVNLQDALQGQAAGLLVINDAGEPGAEGSITIRGGSTFSSAGNSPLYVIDGVVGASATNLNPNDIQSIDVLKDAASSAIYGSRAANGVIIITTKRGQEGKPRIDGRYLHTFGWLAHKLRQANATEVRMFRQLQGSSGGSTDSLNPGFNVDNDYQEALTQLAQKDQYDLSISGGAKNLSYYNSIRFVNDKGLIINSWGKQASIRTNIDFQPSARFKWSNRFQFGYRKRNNINEGNTINQTFQRPTNYRLYLPDGSLAGYISGRRNPLAIALLDINNEEDYTGSLFSQVEYTLSKSLKFTGNAGLDYGESRDVTFTPKFNNSDGITNSGSEGFSRAVGWQVQTFLNYSKTFNQDHRLSALLGFSAERDQSNSSTIAGRNYVNEQVLTLNSAREIITTSTRTSGGANTLASVFERLEYSYKGRYSVNGVIRHDGSSRFGKDKQWGLFPSAAFAWRFSDEKFMAFASSILSDAKLRISYGQTGNESIGNYEARQRYGFGSYYYNGVSGIAYGNTLGNEDLSWESNIQSNIGLDLTFLKGRITVNADYYVKTTKDLLYNRPLPRETGFNDIRVNLGSFETKGFEFAVNATPIRKKDYDWNIIANTTVYRGTVKQLYNGESFIAGNTSDGGNAGWLIEQGSPLGNFYGWKALDVYAYNESNAYDENWQKLTPNFDAAGAFTGYTIDGKPYTGKVNSLYGKGAKLRAGDVEFVNYTKDSVIDDKDRTILGNAQPSFYAAIINTFRYKQLSLSFTLNTMWGNKIYNNAARALDDYGTSNIIPRPQTIYDMWRKPGDITAVPPYTSRNDRGSMRMNDRWLEDGSFLRLAYLRLTYGLKPKLAKKLFMQGLNAYIYGSNLVTWTNYSWFDPEFSSNDPLQIGQDGGRYPRRREVGLGLNVNF